MMSHTEAHVKKVKKVLGLKRQSFVTIEKDSLNTLYKSFIRPHLAYCNAVTFLQLECQVKFLERVQRRATKFYTRAQRTSVWGLAKKAKSAISLLQKELRRYDWDVQVYTWDLHSFPSSSEAWTVTSVFQRTSVHV